ncbi:lipoate-Protein ligase [Arthrobacter sp. Hiyo1]|nr:lipoate-Protein ligase [Arthrobacter sp. Hiyo1]
MTSSMAFEQPDPLLHGEYKVHGGKLVVVDLDVVDGQFAHVSLSGDFFLEPDEALQDINRALTGLPESSTPAEISAAVSAALPADAVLFGFSADAVAVAVRRALSKASGGRTTSGRSSRRRSFPPTSM